MPDQYDIDYAQQVPELLPPDKRYKNTVGLLSVSMTSTLQFLRDAVLGDYRLGSTVSAWVDPADSMVPYARGAKVNYKKAIFVSLVDNNTDIPTDETSWYMQQQFFIGFRERIAYNGMNLVLTFALNRWFGTTFRQPGGGLSDIYITTNAIASDAFLVGFSEAESSAAGWQGSDQYIGDPYTADTQYNAVIHVPAAVYAALQPAAESLIRSFADKYMISGVIYQIVTY